MVASEQSGGGYGVKQKLTSNLNAGFRTLGTVGIWASLVFVVGAVLCISSILELYPLDANSSPVTSCDNQKCLQI